MDGSDGSRALPPAATLNRRELLRGIAVIGAVAGAGDLLAACSSSNSSGHTAASRGPRRGGNLKVGLTGASSSDTVDPHKGLTYLDSSRLQSLYSPLVQLDADAQLEYMLADSITAENPTFTEWVIKLRQGVTFHSGKPLTAEDVVFTFNRIVSNKFSGTNPLGPIDLKSTKALDTHTVSVKMTTPYSSFVEQLAASWVYLYIAPAGFTGKAPWDGTGPFMFKSFTPGTQSVFTRNPHYWRTGRPYADTLTIIDFTDTASLANALVTGVVDGAGTLDGPQMASLGSASGVKAVASKAGGIVPFTMRVDQPPFHDVRVRQAMRLLVDRAQLIDSALDGYGTVASDVFSPFDPDFDTALVRHTDIAQAKSLLKAAGQSDLTVTLTTSQIATGTVAMATVFEEQAKRAGVTIKVRNVPSSTFFGPSYLKWNFAQDYYNYFPYLPQVSESMLLSSPFNETHTNNPYYRSLYDQANATSSGSSLQKELLYRMQEFDFNEGGYIIPAFVDSLDAYSDKIRGYTSARIGQPLSNFGMENWYFI